MNETPLPIKNKTPDLKPVPPTEVDYLRQIAEHLKSIRSMLAVFTFIIVMIIIFWIFSLFVAV